MDFEQLSRGSNAKLHAGGTTFTIEQVEYEIDNDTEIGKKLKAVESELDKY